MKIVLPEELDKAKSRDLIALECERCGDVFKRAKNQVQAVLKGAGKGRLKYCSKTCQHAARRNKVKLECGNCSIEILKSPSEVNRVNNHFCSKSCSASWNNRHSDRTFGPKRTRFTYCKVCDVEISNYNVYCKDHKPKVLSEKNIGEAESKSGKYASAYSSIRDQARKLAKRAGLLDKCKMCDYQKHIMTCHIKSISDFSKDILISEVNDISNLVGLCPNHHWEFDNDMLDNPLDI